jgi:hypothetical protein
MLHTLAAAVALATTPIDLPDLFSDQLPKVTARTEIAVLLPETMPGEEGQEYFPTGYGRARRWGLQIGAVAGCGGATACFVASFSARKGGRPFGPREVSLARGRTGRFKPLTCGASCSPPSIQWRERGATYSIQAHVGPKQTERRNLVRMANSAIRNGPR